MTPLHLFLGGHDLEMATIADFARTKLPPGQLHDKHLAWGAKASVYLDEIEAGQVVELGGVRFTREAVLDFARKFDPQPFHIDDEAAARGPFGKLAASGWHTAACWMKCYVATNQAAEARMPWKGESPAFSDHHRALPISNGRSRCIQVTPSATGRR